MNINLKHCTTKENKRPLENLQQLYLHDLSEFANDLQIDKSGKFENDDITHYFE
ncbi:MAG: hypothetical protein JEZ08_07520 [Clostridiales bacterium]|nr:hypothetical protein [Clostridiales bacterium]